MDSLNEFKKYVETKINSIAENNKLIEQSQNLVDKLENLYAFLTDKNYAGIDLNSFRDCLNFVFDGNDRRWIFSVGGGAKNMIWRKNEMHNVYNITSSSKNFISFRKERNIVTWLMQ